ncbi:uncharacterized protein LOC110840282 isoform X2 [Zootermopsis nevadensis]|uniref:uncharacterized protein LOC110840282 isoform X2 n=1 Tax=Zootermopsis nevadensis TaxID=136037 RepID=UPI000B8EADB5|nr:uncharacterized protein LOC110840282 isoform X2 [Zootermopsis nevadensis]
MIYPGLTTGSPYISYSKLGPCAEKPFLPMWKFCSLVSVFINLIMVYGALTEQSLPVVPWIVWHIAMPLVQFSVFKWNNIKLATCQGIISSDGSGISSLVILSVRCLQVC